MISTVFFLSALVPLVAAHGWVMRVALDDVIYAGPDPTNGNPASTAASPIRQIASNGPITDLTSADLACGNSALPAALDVPAAPGAKIAFQWFDGATPWIHQVGPMLTYMASCGTGACKDFDASKAAWFKIDAIGQTAPDGSSWFQNYTSQGYSTTVTLPTTLQPGNYLVRHEIIALHRAASVGGAEFYPSCTQIALSGAGTASALSSETVKFPGAYAARDPGILFDVSGTDLAYTMPGGALSQFAMRQSAITANFLKAPNATRVDAEKRELPGAHRMRRVSKRHA